MSEITHDRGATIRVATAIGNALLEHPRYGIAASAIAQEVGVSKRTAIRYLNELWSAGWSDPTTIDPKPGRKWRPGPVLSAWSGGRAI